MNGVFFIITNFQCLLTLEFMCDEDSEHSLGSLTLELPIVSLKAFFTRFWTLVIVLRKLFLLWKWSVCLDARLPLSPVDKFLCKLSSLVKLILEQDEDWRRSFKYFKRDNQFLDFLSDFSILVWNALQFYSWIISTIHYIP